MEIKSGKITKQFGKEKEKIFFVKNVFVFLGFWVPFGETLKQLETYKRALAHINLETPQALKL